MRKLKLSFTAAVILAILIGCASFTKTSYVTLNESKDLYVIAMTTVANFQNQGMIDQATRLKINEAAKIYKEAHNLAVDALYVYKQTSSAENKDKLILAISLAASKWSQVAALINAIKPGSVPATFSK